jgi:hypothetical protein
MLQLYRVVDVRKSHARNSTLATVPGVNVWRAVIVGKYVDHCPSAFGDKHPAHNPK